MTRAQASTPPATADGTRSKMVIYFGDTQYDILPVASVVPFSARPKPSGKGVADLARGAERQSRPAHLGGKS